MHYLEKSFPQYAMTTDIFICIFSERFDEKILDSDINNVLEIIKKFESDYSRFLKTSLLSKINSSKSITKVSDEFLDILDKSFYYQKLTNGLFNVFILNDLIDEGYEVSKQKGFYLGNADRNKNNIQIDFGGIGKGYLVDKICKYFDVKYVNYCVDIGGDLYCAGQNPNEIDGLWNIDIEDPFNKNKSLGILQIKNRATATSGVNKRTWIKNNLIKSHIIDPRTKKSINNDLISVTVVKDSATEADIFAKTLLIMGEKQAISYSVANNIASFLVNKDQDVHISAEMRKYLYHES